MSRSLLALAFVAGVVAGAGGCRKQPVVSEQPDAAPQVAAVETVDGKAICLAGCQRLERCVPEIVEEIDAEARSEGAQSNAAVVASRLARECASSCDGFGREVGDSSTALAVDACLDLSSCGSFWSCVGADQARPWLATVAPVGDRSCENLCSQAGACAINRVCEVEVVDPGRRPKPGKPGKNKGDKGDKGEKVEVVVEVDAEAHAAAQACLGEVALRNELEESCLLQCRATGEDSRARFDLVGCLDAGSCDGMLSCLDGWASTDYAALETVPGAVPGMEEACDAFCTRAIVCGAEQEGLELGPEAIAELKQTMTSTYVECAVQCEKDIDDDAARERFSKCAAAEACSDFQACADAM